MITKKTKIYLGSSVVFFGISISAVVLAWGYVNATAEKLLDQAQEVANYNAREKTYSNLEKLVDSTSSEREALLQYSLTEDKTIDFLSEVEQIAQAQGVTLTTNALNVAKGSGFFDTLSISFSVEGTKQQVYKLISIFETLPYEGYVSLVSFRNYEKDGVSFVEGAVELQVTLLQYDK